MKPPLCSNLTLCAGLRRSTTPLVTSPVPPPALPTPLALEGVPPEESLDLTCMLGGRSKRGFVRAPLLPHAVVARYTR